MTDSIPYSGYDYACVRACVIVVVNVLYIYILICQNCLSLQLKRQWDKELYSAIAWMNSANTVLYITVASRVMK